MQKNKIKVLTTLRKKFSIDKLESLNCIIPIPLKANPTNQTKILAYPIIRLNDFLLHEKIKKIIAITNIAKSSISINKFKSTTNLKNKIHNKKNN